MTTTLTLDDAPRPLVRDATSIGYLVIAATALLHVCMAPLRRLTFDEAYYACGSAHGTPWPIPQHPPLLGVLLRATEPLSALPVELRVRLVPIVLSVVTSLGVAHLAANVAPPRVRAQSFAIGATLASWGLLPMAGAVQAIPEMPLLASLAWLLVVATSYASREAEQLDWRTPAMGALAACAVASKVSALLCVFAVMVALVRRGAKRGGAAIAAGSLVALTLGVRSLLGQSAHAMGRGPWISTPHLGVAASLALAATAMLVVFGPAALVIGARSSALERIPGGLGCVLAIAGACLVSGAVSGRPPEVHWFAPASLPLYAAAAATLAGRARWARRVLASHVLPTVVAVIAWCMPLAVLERSTDFFTEAPHVAFSTVDDDLAWTHAAEHARTIPAYGMSSWQCLYAKRCDALDRTFAGGTL